MTAPTPDELDNATIDLIFALRDSLTDDGPSRLDFWGGRAATAVETAAAGATTAGEAVTIAARKLQIDTLTNDAAKTVVAASKVIDRDVEAWAAHVARNIVYIVALANVAREGRKTARAAKTTQPTTEEMPF